MIIELEYWLATSLRRRTCGFNDVTGAVGAPKQWFDPYPGEPTPTVDHGGVVYTGGGYTVRAMIEYPYFFVEDTGGGGAGPSCTLSDLQVTVLTTDGGAGGSLRAFAEVPTGIPQFKISNGSYDSGWVYGVYDAGNTWEYIFEGVPAGDYQVFVRDVEVVGCQAMVDSSIESAEVQPDLTATVTGVNESAPDLNDGKLNVSILTGSGSYKVTWWDASETPLSGAPAYASKFNLAAGIYSTTIEDLVTGQILNFETEITEPVIVPPVIRGDFLEFPVPNPIRTVIVEEVDNITTFQTPDNTLFCNQYYPGHQRTNYFYKACKADNPTQQFNSNYPNHKVELMDENDEVVKTFPVVKKLALSDYTENHNIKIRNHSGYPNQSRVYSTLGGSIPVPVAIGDAFTVVNNPDGFNGTYSVVSIEVDPSDNSQYLVINKGYAAPGAFSYGVGKFLYSQENYNVYEYVCNFVDVDNGYYYIRVTAFDDVSEKVGTTEPLHIKLEHPDTVLLEYRNEDNAQDFSWETGFIGKMRIEGLIGHDPLLGSEHTVIRSAKKEIITTAASVKRGQLFEVFLAPPYVHEQLNAIFALDYKAINKLEYGCLTGWGKPQKIPKVMLFSSSIELEQKGYMRNYNSHDPGSISDSGFVLTNGGGFIKRTL